MLTEQAARYSWEPSWPVTFSGDRGTGTAGMVRTISLMRRAALGMEHSSELKQLGVDWSREAAPSDHYAQVAWINYRLRPRWRFVRAPLGSQEIFGPDVHLWRLRERGSTFGDCANLATFTAAMANALGMRVRFHAVDLAGAGFNHVFTEVQTPEGWRSMDFVDRCPPIRQEAVFNLK